MSVMKKTVLSVFILICGKYSKNPVKSMQSVRHFQEFSHAPPQHSPPSHRGALLPAVCTAAAENSFVCRGEPQEGQTISSVFSLPRWRIS